MILKQLIDNTNPIAYWTGESYTNGNVFDEYANWTLVNTNTSLGVQGGSSPSLSSRAINLNGGYLRISDGSFLNSQIAVRDFSIGFSFRVYNRSKDNPIVGFKPIISKWNPEQSFMIGFENGIIVAKIQTSGGLVEVEFDYPDIIYNDRWNYVQLNVTTTSITLWVNGCPVSVNDSSNIISTTASLFQIGGENTETFNEDVYVADIAVTKSITDEFSRMLYTFPRTPHTVMLDFNPTHYFNLLDAPHPDAPHVNLGSAGGYGYIVYSGDAPTKVKFNEYMDEDAINFPEGSKLVVDTIPDIDLTGGFSMVVRGGISTSGMTSNSIAAHDIRMLEARNSLDNNNGRFLISYNYLSSPTQQYFGWLGYDANGSQLVTSPAYNDDAYNHFDVCSNVYKFKSGGIQFSTTRYFELSESADTTYTLGYDLPLAINHLDLWSNVGTDNIRANIISLFGYELPDGVSAIINPPKFRMISQHILDKYSSELVWLLWGIGGNIAYEAGLSFGHPLTNTNGYSYVSSSYDPAHNRQNDFPRTLSLPTNDSYIGGSTTDNINLGGSGGMTIYAFVWNRNLQDRYRWIYSTSGIDLEIWMNSRDGVLSYGDIEVMLDKDVTNSHLSTTTRDFTDNGFVFFAVTRDGNELSIWVNGEVVASKILASVPSYETSNSTLRMHGGPLYVNDWGVFMAPLNATDFALTSYGLQDYISGQCNLNTVELPSVLLATDSHDGRVMKTKTTDNDGYFKFFLPKSLDGKAVTVLALAQDDNATNNVVAHGPYNLQTDYRKYSFEQTAQDYDDMVLEFEPYAYYKMDETSGTTIVDSSGNGYDGTVIGGITLNQTSFNSDTRAITFNGVDGHIDLPDGYSDQSLGVTIELWANTNQFGLFDRMFSAAVGSNSNSELYLATGSSNGDLYLTTTNSAGNSNTGLVTNPSSVTTSVWAHIVGRITPDGTYSLWVNGTKVAEETGQSLPDVGLRTINYIGRSGSENQFFDGSISNLSTYDYPLPDEEIERHSARGYGIPIQTLKSLITRDNPYAYWTFDRLDQYTNQTDESVAPLTQNGTFSIVKNALAINAGVVGNNYLKTDDVALDDNGDGWTIEFSFKTGSTQVLAILLAEWNTTGGNVGTFKAQLNNSNLLSVHLNDDSTQIVSTTLYNDDEWHHVVIANDGNGTTRLYVDGSEEDSITTAITYGGNEFSIGNSADGNTSTATEAATYLDDVAIYKYGLNVTRITEHYNQFVKKKVYQ